MRRLLVFSHHAAMRAEPSQDLAVLELLHSLRERRGQVGKGAGVHACMRVHAGAVCLTACLPERSVAVLVTCAQNQEHVAVGVVRLLTQVARALISGMQALLSLMLDLQGGLVQCGLILLAGLLLWGFRTSDEGYGFIQ